MSHENKCDNPTCGKKFGLVRYRYWPYQFCCKACQKETLSDLAKERRAYYQRMKIKPPDYLE